MKLALLLGVIAFLLIGSVAPAVAGTVTVNDPFDGPNLDPAWTVDFDSWGWGGPSAGWTYHFADGALHVTDIADGGGVDQWSSVRISRTLQEAGDFSFALDVGWLSAEGDSDVKSLYFSLYDTGNLLARVAYGDAWVGTTGQYFTYDLVGGIQYDSGLGSLPHSGRDTFEIARTSGNLSLKIGGAEVASSLLENPAVRLGIEFKYYPSANTTFDELALYDLEGSYEVVPLPSAAWAGLGLLGLLGVVRRYRRRRAA
jgi:hypothetical protein